MNPEVFKSLLEELDGNSVKTLAEKNARYAQNGDCLHNFRSGADIAGGTPAKACWGYLTKHLVALRDMVEKDNFSNREDFLEKCQDTINYIRFLWCIGNDENSELKVRDVFGRDVNIDASEKPNYRHCKYYVDYSDGDQRCAGTEKFDPCQENGCNRMSIVDFN